MSKTERLFLSRRRRWNCILRLSEPRGASSFVSSFVCAARWAPIAAELYLWKHTAPPVRTSPRRAERLSRIRYRPPLPVGLLRNDCSSSYLIPSCREIIRYTENRSVFGSRSHIPCCSVLPLPGLQHRLLRDTLCPIQCCLRCIAKIGVVCYY